MLRIDTSAFQILAEFRTEEPAYPFREGKVSKNLYRIMTDGKIILIGNFYVEGEFKGKLGAKVFFQRENLKQIIQAIEDWLDDEKSARKEHIEIIEGEDDFLVTFGHPDRFDARPVLMMKIFREAEINGYSQRACDLVTAPEAGYKLIAELKKIDKSFIQTESQRLVER